MVFGPFMTTTMSSDPLDGRVSKITGGTGGAYQLTGEPKEVSDFVTVQSLTNFAAMTGALTAAWAGLRQVPWAFLDSKWIPFILSVFFGVISYIVSDLPGSREKWAAGLIGFLNALILFAAVVGSTQVGSAVT
jgi:hypothetical protein